MPVLNAVVSSFNEMDDMEAFMAVPITQDVNSLQNKNISENLLRTKQLVFLYSKSIAIIILYH